LAWAMATALALPTTVTAKPGYTVEERSLKLALSPEASNGYLARITTAGHRQVTLTVRKKGGGTVKYTTTGQVSRHGIEADFGQVGRISVRFRGTRRPFSGPLPPELESQLPELDFLRRDCHGRKPVREVGSFRGTIRFEGENGFTRIAVASAPGEVKRFYTRVCEGGLGSLPNALKGIGGPRLSLLFAADREPSRTVFFESFQLKFGPPLGSLTSVRAQIVERAGGMRIDRLTSDLGEDGSVILSPPHKSPTTATVALSNPFSGTADYRKDPASPPTWLGSLAVRLPGAGLVPLTGPGFEAVICRFRLEDIFSSPCLRRADIRLPGPVKTAPPSPSSLAI
jgi:hypothetical protein